MGSVVVCEAGGSGVEVALLRDAGRSAGRRQVGGARRRPVTGHLQQVRADRVQPVVPGDPLIGLELSEQVKPRASASGHGHRDGVVQRHHGVVGGPHQQLVQRRDLWPVGRLGTWRFVVDRGDSPSRSRRHWLNDQKSSKSTASTRTTSPPPGTAAVSATIKEGTAVEPVADDALRLVWQSKLNPLKTIRIDVSYASGDQPGTTRRADAGKEKPDLDQKYGPHPTK
jgi:hypothetical protein